MDALTPQYLRVLKDLWLRYDGNAWEPQNPHHEFFTATIKAGYLRRVDGRCGFEKFKDSHVAWTEAGIAAMRSATQVAV